MAIVYSILTYGSQCWTFTKTLTNKINSFQNKILRLVAGNWPNDGVNNQKIRKKLNMYDNWGEKAFRNKLNYIYCMMIDDQNLIKKQIIQLQFLRTKAKSKVKTHADCFNDIIRYAKDNLENICKKAKVEENWEEVVTTMVVSQAETKPKPRKML